MPIKNCGLLFLMSVLLCILLTSCGDSNPPKETKIIQELPDDITMAVIENPFDAANADVYYMDVVSLSIEKRQTNDKEDIVYCIVELGNQYYHFSKYVTLYYNYYDQGGWMLDNWEYYQNTEYRVLSSPFSGEEILPAAQQRYAYSEYSSLSENWDKNEATFHFSVNEPHTNGTYTGDYKITCRFDGVKWETSNDASDVQFLWDIEGTWQYENSAQDVFGKSYSYGIILIIDDFDRDTLTGSLEMFYKNYGFGYLLTSSENIGITIDKSEIEIFTDPNIVTMHSYVHFTPDEAVGCKAGYSGFGPVQLQRVESSFVNSEDHHAEKDQAQILSGVIDQYFEIVKSGVGSTNESMQALLEAFPNMIGDDVIAGLQDALEENTIGDFGYEIVTANQYDMNQADARRMWEIVIEEEFTEGIPDPECYAEVLVKMTYSGEGVNLPYCDVLLVKDHGTWGVFYVDDGVDEDLRMLFPFGDTMPS